MPERPNTPDDVPGCRTDSRQRPAGVPAIGTIASTGVLVVGGGFGGLQATLGLRRAGVDITLVDRRNFHLFQPLTYQVATGALSPGEIAYPLRAIFKRDRNVRVLLAEVARFDLERREVVLRSGRRPADTGTGAL